MASLTNVLGHHLASGEEPRRWGTGHPDIVPYQVFAARDGHLVVAVGNDAQFARLLEVIGRPADPRFGTNPDRVARRDELIAAIAARITDRDRDELVAALSAADIPAGPVRSVSEALAAMQAAHGNAWIQDAGGVTVAPDPIRIDGERLPLRLPPPAIGEGTDEYKNPAEFFRRTYLTESLKRLLVGAVQRLSGNGSDPVWRNPFHRKKGEIAAQGYHVFALPAAAQKQQERASAGRPRR